MGSLTEDLAIQLFDIEAVKFGDFKLKSGIISPVYFDLRVIISFPKLMEIVSEQLWSLCLSKDIKLLCGVPYTALPIASVISVKHNIPMVIRRKEAKDYGTKKILEGRFEPGQECLVIEDVVTSGSSVLETAEILRKEGLQVSKVLVLVDREQGGRKALEKQGIKMISVFTLRELLHVLHSTGQVKADMVAKVETFLAANQCPESPSLLTVVPKIMPYSERMNYCVHPVGRRIYELMSQKATNLCLAADVASSEELLRLSEAVGPHIVALKTHADMILDWSPEVGRQLRQIADRHEFLVFEDRKLGDIGQTVAGQASLLCSWCDLVTVHGVPGSGVLAGVKQACGLAGRDVGCLLVAQMSSEGALTTSEYTTACVTMADKYRDLVLGFISQSRVTDDSGFMHWTPGVKMNAEGDKLGQQYNSPREVMRRGFCDVIIVGRGITEANNPVSAAIRYKQESYSAYLELTVNEK